MQEQLPRPALSSVFKRRYLTKRCFSPFLNLFPTLFLLPQFSSTNTAMKNTSEKNLVTKAVEVKCSFRPCQYSNNKKALSVHISQHHRKVDEPILGSWKSCAMPIWELSKPVLKCMDCQAIFNDRRSFLNSHHFALSCPKCTFFRTIFERIALSLSLPDEVLLFCFFKNSSHRRGFDLGRFPRPAS